MNRELTLTNTVTAKVVGALGCVLLIVAIMAMQAHAQTILIDDFDDGDADGWSIIDTSIDEPWGPGTFDARSGAYHFEGGGLAQAGGRSSLAVVWDESADPIFTDGFVRAKVRSETLGGTAGIMLRYGPGNLYTFFGTTANSGIPGNGAFLYNKVVNGQQVQWRQLPGNFRFGVNEDWYIEAGAVGNRLSMKVWRVGEPEPESPQLTLTDSTHGTGQFGVYSNIHASPFPGPARVSATFDDIYFRFPDSDDMYTVSPSNTYLWEPPMPVPQQEGPYFVAGSPQKPDMRGDVTATEGWPQLHLTGKVTDFVGRGQPIPGLRLDFWQTDDQGNYDNAGGYALRGHVYTDSEGNYELWTVMPAAYEAIRTRHLHLKIGGVNLGYSSPVYTTQLYFPAPYDNDIDADGMPDKVVQSGLQTDLDAIGLGDDFVTMSDLEAVAAAFSDLAANILMINNDPAVDGYFDATLNIRMSEVFQTPPKTPDRILIDNFNDGDFEGWTTIDFSLGQPWGPGTFDASSEAFHFQGKQDVLFGQRRDLNARWDQAVDPIFTDGYVRATFRVNEAANLAGIILRGSGCTDRDCTTGYGFLGTTAWNGILGNGRFFFGRYVAGAPGLELPLPGSLSFGVNEDWIIEAGAVGDRLSMKVWRVGDPEPESPQWTRTDGTLRTGDFGVVTTVPHSYRQPERVDGIIDDIYFTFAEHDDVYTVSPYNIYLWGSPMPVPQQEGPYFVAGSPRKPDMRGDVTAAEGWPELHLRGRVADLVGRGQPIPGLRLDFWQTDDQGNYDNAGGYAFRGHVYTDAEGNYELWTVVPAAYETVRTRHLHLKIGGVNLGYSSPVYTTQLYFPAPYDNDIDGDGIPDKVVQGGVRTEFDAIPRAEDYITLSDLEAAGAEFSDLGGNILTINNNPLADGYFDATLNIRMPQDFQAPQTRATGRNQGQRGR